MYLWIRLVTYLLNNLGFLWPNVWKRIIDEWDILETEENLKCFLVVHLSWPEIDWESVWLNACTLLHTGQLWLDGWLTAWRCQLHYQKVQTLFPVLSWLRWWAVITNWVEPTSHWWTDQEAVCSLHLSLSSIAFDGVSVSCQCRSCFFNHYRLIWRAPWISSWQEKSLVAAGQCSQGAKTRQKQQ